MHLYTEGHHWHFGLSVHGNSLVSVSHSLHPLLTSAVNVVKNIFLVNGQPHFEVFEQNMQPDAALHEEGELKSIYGSQ